jgi:SAM-dependent methyltransferase
MSHDHQKAFTQIYDRATWKLFPWDPLSGSGSKMATTEPYRKLLIEFIKQSKAQTIVDFGCGDWTFSQHIPWQELGVSYLGIDVYAPLIQQHQKTHARDNINFVAKDFTNNIDPLPYGDLWILKDVLQHWPNCDIVAFLKRMVDDRCFKYILLTNCSTIKPNLNIPVGGFRPLNHNEEPLSLFRPQSILEFNGKTTCLIIAKNHPWRLTKDNST